MQSRTETSDTADLKTCCVREGLYKTHIFYKGRHILRRIAGLPGRL